MEGEHIDCSALAGTIESAGAVMHIIDELASGNRLVERVKRVRYASDNNSVRTESV